MGGRLKFTRMSEIPCHSLHFRKAHKAEYARANSLETARVEILTRAIYSGSIKITGSYACVNHIGTYPSDDAPELKAETPVPIKLDHGHEVQGMLGYHVITVAKKVKKKILRLPYQTSVLTYRYSKHRLMQADADRRMIDQYIWNSKQS